MEAAATTPPTSAIASLNIDISHHSSCTVSSHITRTDSTCKNDDNERMVQDADRERLEFSKRLNKAAADAGYDSRGLGAMLSRETGCTPKAASKWLAGESIPKDDNLRPLADLLGVSWQWLKYGEADGFKQTPPQDEGLGSPKKSEYVTIKQYLVSGECGDGYLNDHAEINGGLAFKRDWINRKGLKPEDLLVIYAEGSSMEPFIYNGDVVLFDRTDIIPKHNQVFVIRRPDSSLSIKRLALLVTGKWLIKSDNPDYESEEASAETISTIPIVGRVIWRGGDIF